MKNQSHSLNEIHSEFIPLIRMCVRKGQLVIKIICEEKQVDFSYNKEPFFIVGKPLSNPYYALIC